MRIKYLEEKPVKQIIVFEDNIDYYKFFDKKFNEIFELYGMDYKNKWVHSSFKIKKNGEPAQHNHKPQHLWTKKAQANQKKGFAEYVERRKQATQEKYKRIKLAQIDFKIEQLNKEKEELQNDKNI